VNFALWSRVPPGNRAPVTPAPLCAAKAVKNGAELLGMRRAHARDGAAVVEFLAGLFDEVGAKRPRGLAARSFHTRACVFVRASV
jgi:Xaa-Pro aminopeptidase